MEWTYSSSTTNAFDMISAYESSSDSERDSGYTSEEDKKRKLNCDNFSRSSKPNNNKRLKVDEVTSNENMVIEFVENHSKYSEHKDQLVSKAAKFHLESNINTDATSKNVNIILPLPEQFMCPGPSSFDDASKHQGKIRTFPHDPGNWAAIVYLPLNTATSEGVGLTSFETLRSVVRDAVRLCHSKGVSLTASPDFHISLTKTLLLRIYMIASVAQDIKKVLSGVSRFKIWLNRFEVYVNESKTRTFLGLKVFNGHDELSNVVHRLDRVLETYQLPSFYQECSLHASLAWVVGDQSKDLIKLLPLLEDYFTDYFDGDDVLRSFSVSHVNFKTGNRIHTIHFGTT